MKRRISTACHVSRDNPVAEAPASVDAVYPAGSARSHARLARSGAQLDSSASEIAAKARAAMSVACALEVEHWPISLFDEDGYSTFFEPDRATLTVLCMAVQVEPDPVEAGFWYRRTRIAELDGLTAAQLVSLGRAEEVVRFLVAVRDGVRE